MQQVRKPQLGHASCSMKWIQKKSENPRYLLWLLVRGPNWSNIEGVEASTRSVLGNTLHVLLKLDFVSYIDVNQTSCTSVPRQCVFRTPPMKRCEFLRNFTVMGRVLRKVWLHFIVWTERVSLNCIVYVCIYEVIVEWRWYVRFEYTNYLWLLYEYHIYFYTSNTLFESKMMFV